MIKTEGVTFKQNSVSPLCKGASIMESKDSL